MPGMVSFCVAESYVALPVERFVMPTLSPTEAVCTVPGDEPTWLIDCDRDKRNSNPTHVLTSRGYIDDISAQSAHMYLVSP